MTRDLGLVAWAARRKAIALTLNGLTGEQLQVLLDTKEAIQRTKGRLMDQLVTTRDFLVEQSHLPEFSSRKNIAARLMAVLTRGLL